MTNTPYSAFAFLEQLFPLINKRNVDIAYIKKSQSNHDCYRLPKLNKDLYHFYLWLAQSL